MMNFTILIKKTKKIGKLFNDEVKIVKMMKENNED